MSKPRSTWPSGVLDRNEDGRRGSPKWTNATALWLNAGVLSTASTSRNKHIAREAVDFGFRTAYRVAHRMLRAYWSVRRPNTHGALVALWSRGELLLVKNSYRDHYTLPGGYIHPGETVERAGARELAEECAITVEPSAIKVAYDGTRSFENRNDRVTIVELELDERPAIEIDNREVVWAGFKSPQDILALPLVPHLREYLRART